MNARMDQVLDLQRAAFLATLPVALDLRKDRLRRAAAMIRDHAAAFCTAVSEDFGHRSVEQTMLTDIAASIVPIRHALRSIDGWARRERRAVEFPLGLLGARAWVEFQPKGVVGIIAPWNFPINLVMAPLAGILAAGNRAMVKTSEFTPRVAALFEQIVGDYFAQDELAFFSGGPDSGKAFAALDLDHLIFTGATAVGRHVLHAAADTLTPVTLELGGKSPVIVGRSAGLDRAAERIVIGKMLNAGQICLAPDYLLVPAELEAPLVKALGASASAMYPTLLANPDYTAIVNDRHHDRLTGLIDDARMKGATVTVINPAREDFARSNARKLPLHIITDVTDDMAVMQEEIFGPVLPIRRYDTVDEAIRLINRGGRPLGLYHFGNDQHERRHILDRTISGGVTLDDVLFHISMEDLPFGGIGASGMGSYHGRDGFRTFSHARSVYRQSRLDVARLAGLKPPYGAALRKAVARQIK